MRGPLAYIAFVLSGVLLLGGGFSVLTSRPVLAEPVAAPVSAPTIERVVIAARGASELEGLGTPGSLVQLVADGRALGEVRVAADGRWRLIVKDGLAPGVHQILSASKTDGGNGAVPGDEIRVSVPAELGETAVVAYEGSTEARPRAVDAETRQRAEDLAKAANETFGQVVPGPGEATGAPKVAQSAPRAEREAPPAAAAPEEPGPVGAIVDWMRRSAKAYRGDVVDKLAVTPPGADFRTGTPDITAKDAAAQIAKERAAAEAALEKKRAADAARKAAEADRARAEAQRKEADARKAADDLAKRKQDYDARIKNGLKDLEKAREDADRRTSDNRAAEPRASGAAPGAAEKPKITFERIILPGDRTAGQRTDEDDLVVAEGDGTGEPEAVEDDVRGSGRRSVTTAARREVSSRCRTGRVVLRKGKRWYRTGANDTLWDLSQRFYGNGLHYPRIYRANLKRLSSPHIVRPCQLLRVPGRGR